VVLRLWQPDPPLPWRRRGIAHSTPLAAPTAGKKFSAPRTLRDFVIVARAPKKQ
jgi:hypothetical protein